MGRITLHVGLPKTGSTAIQEWLGAAPDVLAERGVVVATAIVRRGEVEVVVHRDGLPASSGAVVRAFDDFPDRLPEAAEALVDGVLALAEQHPHVVLSGEALSEAWWRPLPGMLDAFDRLGRDHDCTVPIYLRPQHSMLEASWRQWGFRSDVAPSAWMHREATRCHYERLLDATSATPHLDVVFRPFLRDHLVERDVVADFAHHFLGVPTDSSPPTPANIGLPLPVVNLLATLPTGVLWTSPHDNRGLRRVKAALAGLEVHDHDVEEGRTILARWAADQFTAGNRRLDAELGWDTNDWIPDDGGRPRDVSHLDRLWAPSAGPAELAVLHRLLGAL